jgi:hypothetical protein
MYATLLLASSLAVVAIAAAQEAPPDPAAKTAPAAPAVTVPIFANRTCPIMGKPASSSIFVDTTKGRIYVCCAPCIKKIRMDVDRAYKAAYPATRKARNPACPLSGRKIEPDSPVVALQGLEVSVCCSECVKSARASAQITLVKATQPKARDVGNLACPVTGEPADRNTLVLIGDDIVRLHSFDCIEAVRKAPFEVLKEARSIAERERKQEEDDSARAQAAVEEEKDVKEGPDDCP